MGERGGYGSGFGIGGDYGEGAGICGIDIESIKQDGCRVCPIIDGPALCLRNSRNRSHPKSAKEERAMEAARTP